MVREINSYLKHKKIIPVDSQLFTKKAELHCHSRRRRLSYAPFIYDAIQTVEEIIEVALEKNIRILGITDHNSLDGYYEADEFVTRHKLPLLIVPGSEISTTRGHILAYGIKHEITPRLKPDETIRQIRGQGGIAVAAHPYVGLGFVRVIRRLRFDAIEGLNAHMPKIVNRKGIQLAIDLGLPITSGSDAHQLNQVGNGCMVFREQIETYEDVMEAIKMSEFTFDFQHTRIIPSLISHVKSHSGLQKQVGSLET